MRKRFFRHVMAVILTWLPYLAWVPVNRAIVSGFIPPSPWLWLLLPPGLACEWVVYRWCDPPRGSRAATRLAHLGFGLRLAALTGYFGILIIRTAAMMDTPDIYGTLIGFWTGTVLFTYRASPVLGTLGLVGLIALHLWLTVRRGVLRFTTLVMLPGVFTLGLFHFWYHFPNSPLHMLPRRIEPPVERVFPFDDRDLDDLAYVSEINTFYPRDLHVLPDEQTIIATYGKTFQFFIEPQPVHLRRIDLAGRRVDLRRGSVIRLFRSTCSDRLYMATWHRAQFLEVDPVTFDVSPHSLPDRFNGERVEEINYVYHHCESHRVLIGNSRNPVLFIWDTESRRLTETVNLVGLGDLRLGDTLNYIDILPNSGDIVLGLHARWNIVVLDHETQEPLRVLRFPDYPFTVVLSPDGAYGYAAAFFAGKAWKFDTRTMEIVATFDIPLHSRRLFVTPDGRYLIAAGYITGEVVTVDTETGRQVSRFEVGPKAEGLYLSPHYIWTSTASGIYRIPLDVAVKAQE